ncbi:hypothetical protein EAS64_02480 [Trebonia kvetii]|uniref:Uncharacterized protein n=1 Tax=Trebonia kvetii TaxID=2480626 RepID=A0A6P2C7K6_9ACTN|nr:hypothetical protein [Trebonia kvetii]TVZ06316.1 hypothetical protein EAS64_02480 [Trebonia kvetii]
MMRTYSRTMHPDLTIMMSEPFANPAVDVELRLPGGAVAAVGAAVLNHEYARQQAAYAAEAHVDAEGVLRGRSGARRSTNRIRLVDVAHLIGAPGDRIQPAAWPRAGCWARSRCAATAAPCPPRRCLSCRAGPPSNCPRRPPWWPG